MIDEEYIDMMNFLEGYKPELYELNNRKILGIDDEDIYCVVKYNDGKLFVFKFCKKRIIIYNYI